MLNTSYFVLNLMHKVKTQNFGSCSSRTYLFLFFYMVIIKNYKVKKLVNKYTEKLE